MFLHPFFWFTSRSSRVLCGDVDEGRNAWDSPCRTGDAKKFSGWKCSRDALAVDKTRNIKKQETRNIRFSQYMQGPQLIPAPGRLPRSISSHLCNTLRGPGDRGDAHGQEEVPKVATWEVPKTRGEKPRRVGPGRLEWRGGLGFG